MKKIVLLSLFYFLSIAVYAQGVIFEDLTLKQALTKAKSDNNHPQLIFIDCYTSWCGPCKEMTEKVFPLKICGDFFNANFINLAFDMEKGEGKEIASTYTIIVYPTFLILDTDGNEINRVIGGGNPASFIRSVREAMNPANAPSTKKVAYEQDKNCENLIAYIEALEKAYRKNEASEVIKSTFHTLNSKEKYAPTIWRILSSPGQDLSNADSELFGYLLLNKYEADNALGKAIVDEHLMKIFKVFFSSCISGNRTYPKEIIERNIICANAIANNDYGLQYMLKMLWAKNEGKIDELVKMLSYNIVRSYNFTLLDKEMIEKAVTGIRDLTPEQKSVVAQYFKEKHEALTREADYATSYAERFEDKK